MLSSIFYIVYISDQGAHEFRRRTGNVHLHIWNWNARYFLPKRQGRLKDSDQTVFSAVDVSFRIQLRRRIRRYDYVAVL